MHLSRLPTLGWTVKEIKHVERVLARAEKNKDPWLVVLEHALLWLLIISLLVMSMGIVAALIPLILLGNVPITIIMFLLLGTCLGLLFVHVIHDLQIRRPLLHVGVSFLVFSTIVLVTLFLSSLPEKMGFVQPYSLRVVFSLVFVSGIIVTYLAHWRLTHETR